MAEPSREGVGLTLLGELSKQDRKGEDSQGKHLWQYVLQDEVRRCFAGKVNPGLRAYDLKRFYATVQQETEWGQPVSATSGEPIPRKTAWMVADSCVCPYRYGGVEVEPDRFPPWMVELMETFMPFCGLRNSKSWPTCCNLNLYEDGGMSVGWHADDEDLFQGRLADCPIISLSLGETRTFELRPNAPAEGEQDVHRLVLENGDLMTMEGLTQKHYQHRVPKERARGSRINLTWRWIKKHRPQCPCGRQRN